MIILLVVAVAAEAEDLLHRRVAGEEDRALEVEGVADRCLLHISIIPSLSRLVLTYF
jgi:hypothetical protein